MCSNGLEVGSDLICLYVLKINRESSLGSKLGHRLSHRTGGDTAYGNSVCLKLILNIKSTKYKLLNLLVYISDEWLRYFI